MWNDMDYEWRNAQRWLNPSASNYPKRCSNRLVFKHWPKEASHTGRTQERIYNRILTTKGGQWDRSKNLLYKARLEWDSPWIRKETERAGGKDGNPTSRWVEERMVCWRDTTNTIEKDENSTLGIIHWCI